jgi:preprotein translocase subunit YajC
LLKIRTFVALTCLLLVGVAGAGAADDWQRVHGKVQSVSGNTVTVKADDGRVLTVDASQVSADIRDALKPDAGVTLIGQAGAQANQFTAQYIQQDASDPLRGGTIVGPAPPPASDRSWQRVHGAVQSVSGHTVSVKTDDGRTLTVHAGQVSADIRGNLAKDEQKDSSAGAATSAPSALPGPVDEKSWRRIHGTVSSVSGATLSLKADDGRAISVDVKEVGEAIRQSLSAGETVTVVGFYRGDQNTVAARFVQKDSSNK